MKDYETENYLICIVVIFFILSINRMKKWELG